MLSWFRAERQAATVGGNTNNTIQVLDILLNILTLGCKPIYEKNLSYYRIVNDFREKLPRPQNTANEIRNDELINEGLPRVPFGKIVNLSNLRPSLTEADIDQFYNKLEHFNYQFVLFPQYYKKFTKNLMRFNPRAENKNFDLYMLQLALKDNPDLPLKPIPVLLFHIKRFIYKKSSSHKTNRH